LYIDEIVGKDFANFDFDSVSDMGYSRVVAN
jgi:hypothetical protein